MAEYRDRQPSGIYAGCSTAGEIMDTRVHDHSIVATAITFEHSYARFVEATLAEGDDAFSAAKALSAALPHEGLRSVLVLSDGLHVNGSDLARGLVDALPDGTLITGGLSGDGPDFGTTYVVAQDRLLERGVIAIGFYGERLHVGHGCLGGWDPFGPERKVTRSEGNVLLELEGHSALELYKRYLGEYASELPSSALLFPLSIRDTATDTVLVRTVLGVDDEAGTMTFAGDIPEGSYARFMMANFDRVIDGAGNAASQSRLDEGAADVAILISCVGRKLVLDQRVEEEVEGVREALGPQPVLAGFYSYGELSPLRERVDCELHNQTMTVTALGES